MAKVCSKCGIEKDESEFQKRKGVTPYYAECIQCKHLRGKAWYNLNKEKKSATNKAREARPEVKIRRDATRRAWRAANQVKHKTYNAAYTRARKLADPLFKLARTTRSSMIKSMNRHGFRKNGNTAQLLGCYFEDFMKHLGPKPCDNPELDHICPVSQAKTEDEFNKLQSYINFQWLSKEDNLKKSDKQTNEGLFMCRFLLGRDWIYD
jgi:hypothetical protein